MDEHEQPAPAVEAPSDSEIPQGWFDLGATADCGPVCNPYGREIEEIGRDFGAP